VPVTVYGVTVALARNPDAVASMQEAGFEIACHARRWIDHGRMPQAEERARIAAAVALHTTVTGERPLGWYTGRMSANTTRLVAEVGGFAYQADSYADDLPCWRHFGAKPELIVPYTLDTNDMRFGNATGFTEGAQFERYLTDAFDTLYAEGMEGAPKMMSVGLHCRLVGRPARFAGLKRFLDHVQRHERVWLPRRIHIARHWRAEHPPA
jgi:peptidoglycan/xylan/chitin deacetylase (PgdA/CDA1 family)